MLDHGLGRPEFAADDGCVVVALPGPADNMDRVRVPASVPTGLTPTKEQALNDRQRAILHEAVTSGSVTTSWCLEALDVVKDTARRDFTHLVALSTPFSTSTSNTKTASLSTSTYCCTGYWLPGPRKRGESLKCVIQESLT